MSGLHRAFIEKRELGRLEYLDDGGHGRIYRAPNVDLTSVGTAVYKEYPQEILERLDIEALTRLVAFFQDLSLGHAVAFLGLVAWPLKIVINSGRITGYIMPEVPKRFRITLVKPSGGKQDTLAHFNHLLNPPVWLMKQKLDFPESTLIRLIREVAKGMAQLHRYRIVVGDVSPKNLLFALKPQVKCHFIDCDSMCFDGRSPHPQSETPNWGVSVLRREPPGTEASDSFKLGLLSLRLLVRDHFARDPGDLSTSVPAALRRLIEGSLAEYPEARPSAQTWVDILKDVAR